MLITSTISAQLINYADSVVDFSSEYDPLDWSAQQALGLPDVYPMYGDIQEAWAPEDYFRREFLELYFENAVPIDSIYIYETYISGCVDTVYVKDPGTGAWNIVYQATPVDLGYARILRIGFPMTTYNVSEIRIAVDGEFVDDYTEIDAVAVVNSQITGIQNNKFAESVSVFPNPSQGTLNIDLGDNTEDVSLKVFSVLGEMVFQKERVNTPQYQFELDAVPGTYIVELSTKTDKAEFKLVME
jgi:hypothetical protein